MTEFLDHIRNEAGEAIVQNTCRTKESSCTIYLKESNTLHVAIDRVVAIDVDKAVIANKSLIPKESKRCDFLIIVDKGDFYLVLPVEVKTGTVKASDIKEQIKGGLEIFERLTKDFVDKRIRIEWLPYYLSEANNRYINQSQNKNSILFRGKNLTPIFVKCGSAFFANVKERLAKSL